jgi:hypothetical protein
MHIVHTEAGGAQNQEIFCVTATVASTMHSSVTIGGGMTTGADNHLSSHRCASTTVCLSNSSTPLLLLCEQPSALPFPNLEPSPAHHPARSIHNAHLGIKNATTPLVMVLNAIGIAPTNRDWLECLYRCLIVSLKKIARPNMRQLNSINRPTFKLQTARAMPCWPAPKI